ncbi:MAG: hypothetical protein QOF55_2344, partial [Thermoleophilaceae bacterium]|nr:hypothetical protein [Thermoleophilaceae bacterium]
MTPGPPPVPGGRSDEERERARLEREARRSGVAPATPAGGSRWGRKSGGGDRARPTGGDDPSPGGSARDGSARDGSARDG